MFKPDPPFELCFGNLPWWLVQPSRIARIASHVFALLRIQASLSRARQTPAFKDLKRLLCQNTRNEKRPSIMPDPVNTADWSLQADVWGVACMPWLAHYPASVVARHNTITRNITTENRCPCTAMSIHFGKSLNPGAYQQLHGPHTNNKS